MDLMILQTVVTMWCVAAPYTWQVTAMWSVCNDNQSINQSIFYSAPKSWQESWPT